MSEKGMVVEDRERGGRRDKMAGGERGGRREKWSVERRDKGALLGFMMVVVRGG